MPSQSSSENFKSMISSLKDPQYRNVCELFPVFLPQYQHDFMYKNKRVQVNENKSCKERIKMCPQGNGKTDKSPRFKDTKH